MNSLGASSSQDRENSDEDIENAIDSEMDPGLEVENFRKT